MTKQILGIHHVTAIAGEPQQNIDFYSGFLGLRLVKLTVNYDAPKPTTCTTAMKTVTQVRFSHFSLGLEHRREEREPGRSQSPLSLYHKRA